MRHQQVWTTEKSNNIVSFFYWTKKEAQIHDGEEKNCNKKLIRMLFAIIWLWTTAFNCNCTLKFIFISKLLNFILMRIGHLCVSWRKSAHSLLLFALFTSFNKSLIIRYHVCWHCSKVFFFAFPSVTDFEKQFIHCELNMHKNSNNDKRKCEKVKFNCWVNNNHKKIEQIHMKFFA